MHKLISELHRLYLFDEQRYLEADGSSDALTPAVLARHLSGEHTVAVKLVSDSGLARALVMEFGGKGGGEAHWAALCTIANALQHELDLPAPAVSISGTAFQLWLSLTTPVPLAQAQQFVQLLRSTFLPASTDILAVAPPAYLAQAQLPPWAPRLPTNRAWTCRPRQLPNWVSWTVCVALHLRSLSRRWPN